MLLWNSGIQDTEKSMSNEVVKLRVCPFCGGEAEFVEEDNDWFDLPMVIQCVECDACMPAIYPEGKEDIIRKWNTRDILDIAADANDDQIYTPQERADLLFEMIDKYNKYED